MRYLILLLILGGAGFVLAQPPGPGPGPHPERFVEEHAARLGLDAETIEALRATVDASRERGEALHRELRVAHRAMRDLLSSESPDESFVMEQAETIGRLEVEERKNRLAAMILIRSLLTPEQRAELQRIREEKGPRGPRPLRACLENVRRICPDAGPGRDTVQCMGEHWDELSPECRSVFEGGPPGRGRKGRFGPRRW
jgi:Spy/CpxP family protein refolding chaperone